MQQCWAHEEYLFDILATLVFLYGISIPYNFSTSIPIFLLLSNVSFRPILNKGTSENTNYTLTLVLYKVTHKLNWWGKHSKLHLYHCKEETKETNSIICSLLMFNHSTVHLGVIEPSLIHLGNIKLGTMLKSCCGLWLQLI